MPLRTIKNPPSSLPSKERLPHHSVMEPPRDIQAAIEYGLATGNLSEALGISKGYLWQAVQYALMKNQDRDFDFSEYIEKQDIRLFSDELLDTADTIAILCMLAGFTQPKTLATLEYLFVAFQKKRMSDRDFQTLTAKVQLARESLPQTRAILQSVADAGLHSLQIQQMLDSTEKKRARKQVNKKKKK